jgi:hypothetical protein
LKGDEEEKNENRLKFLPFSRNAFHRVQDWRQLLLLFNRSFLKTAEATVIKLFFSFSLLTLRQNKLDRLSLASRSSLVYCFQVKRQHPTFN